jgi:hypothetical protein
VTTLRKLADRAGAIATQRGLFTRRIGPLERLSFYGLSILSSATWASIGIEGLWKLCPIDHDVEMVRKYKRDSVF